MSLKTILVDAKKAVAAATTIEATAVGLGLLNKGQEAVITAILGALTTGAVYFLGNGEKIAPTPASDPNDGQSVPEIVPPVDAPAAPPAAPAAPTGP